MIRLLRMWYHDRRAEQAWARQDMGGYWQHILAFNRARRS